MESRSDETTGRLPPNIRARSDGAIATEWRPTECDALCIWFFCGDSQYPQFINNKKHAPVPARSVASLPASRLAALVCYAVARRSLGLRVFACYALTGAIVCRPTLRRFAPSLRAPFSFCIVPVVARLRRSTTGYCLSPRFTGLRIRLADARKLPFNFRFIERANQGLAFFCNSCRRVAHARISSAWVVGSSRLWR